MGLRVLYVLDHSLPEMSGYAFRSRYLVEALEAHGVEVAVVTSARHREFASPVEDFHGVPYHRTPWPAGSWEGWQLKVPFWRERILTRALARRAIEVGRGFRPHVVHAHSPFFDGLAALRAGRALEARTAYEIRAFWEDDSVSRGEFKQGSPVYRTVRALETRVCRRVDLVVGICNGIRDDLLSRGLSPDKVVIAPNGVDGEAFTPVARDEDLARELGLDGCRVAGFFGSLVPYEGLDLALAALALLKDRHPDLRLLIVGAGRSEQALQAEAARRGLKERVVFAGRVPHERIRSYYGVTDILVYPRVSARITELTTPLKPLEALAMEKLVVASDVGGMREILDGLGAGRLHRAGSAEDLARVLDECLNLDPAACREEQGEGRRAVLARRSWFDQVRGVVEAYERLTGVQPRATADRGG